MNHFSSGPQSGEASISSRIAGFWNGNKSNFAAGLSVIGLLVPEAVAYAGIAGMPPMSGLVALFIGLAGFLVFGSSRFAIVAATSSSAMVLAATVAMQAATHPGADPSALAAVLVIMTGFWFILARVLGFGQIANFVAKPVLRGVTMGLALTITLMQLPKLVGLHANGATPWLKLADAWQHIGSVSFAAAAVGLIALAVLMFWRWPKQPASLWVVVGSVIAAMVLPLESWGVELVGEFSIDKGAIALDTLTNADWIGSIQMSAALCLIVYAESFSSIHSAALRNGDETNDNRDIFALGACNILSGVFGGLAVGAGFSATSLNEQAGATSKLSSATALVVYVLALIFLLPYVSLIPEPVLAAIVIRAVSHGLSPAPAKTYFKWKRDRLLIVASFLSVAILGVLNGLLVSVVLSIALILYRNAQVHVSELRWLEGSHSFVNKRLFKDTTTVEGVLVVRLSQPLFFANADPTFKKIQELIHTEQRTRYIGEAILSMEESADLDGSCVEALIMFARNMLGIGVRLTLCRLHRRAMEALTNADNPFLRKSQLSMLSVHRAVTHAQKRLGEQELASIAESMEAIEKEESSFDLDEMDDVDLSLRSNRR